VQIDATRSNRRPGKPRAPLRSRTLCPLYSHHSNHNQLSTSMPSRGHTKSRDKAYMGHKSTWRT
jgi:hypothetical protein